jgi:hypothetical protein
MAPAFGAVITTPERRDPTASAVARPVNKAPARRAVITTPQSGGPFARVPPANNSTISARIEAARRAPLWREEEGSVRKNGAYWFGSYLPDLPVSETTETSKEERTRACRETSRNRVPQPGGEHKVRCAR